MTVFKKLKMLLYIFLIKLTIKNNVQSVHMHMYHHCIHTIITNPAVLYSVEQNTISAHSLCCAFKL